MSNYKFYKNAKFSFNNVTDPETGLLTREITMTSGTDISSAYLKGSLKVTTTSDYSNTFTAKFRSNPNEIELYQEITLMEEYNDRNLFSGIITNIKPIRVAPHDFIFEVSAESYDMIMRGRTFKGNFGYKYSGDIARDLVYDWMTDDGANSQFSEGITIGLYQKGLLAKNYEVVASSAKKIFDELARNSGFQWYVTNYKVFYFFDTKTLYDVDKQATLPEESLAIIRSLNLFNTLEVDEDLTNSNRLNNVRDLNLNYSLDKYRSKQMVIGNLEGGAKIVYDVTDGSEVTRLKQLNPNLSGIIGATLSNSEITLGEDAEALALKYLQYYNQNQTDIVFKTFNPTFSVQQIFKARYPSAGLSEKLDFVVESLEIDDTGVYDITDENFELNYTVTGRSIDLTKEIRPTENWKKRFYDFAKGKYYSNPDSTTGGSVTNRKNEDSFLKTKEFVIEEFNLSD